MPEYPILFDFRTALAGKGFLAGVDIKCGRALLVQEADGQWWAYGVYPGPIAERGNTPLEAYANLKQALQEVLFHSAELTDDFNAFEADVRKICEQRDDEDSARWEAARLPIRDGSVKPEPSLASLPLKRDVAAPRLMVRHLNQMKSEEFKPEFNRADRLLTAA